MSASQRLLDEPSFRTALAVVEELVEIDPPLTESERDRLAVRLLDEADRWREGYETEIRADLERKDGTMVTIQFGIQYLAPEDLTIEEMAGLVEQAMEWDADECLAHLVTEIDRSPGDGGDYRRVELCAALALCRLRLLLSDAGLL